MHRMVNREGARMTPCTGWEQMKLAKQRNKPALTNSRKNKSVQEMKNNHSSLLVSVMNSMSMVTIRQTPKLNKSMVTPHWKDESWNRMCEKGRKRENTEYYVSRVRNQ